MALLLALALLQEKPIPLPEAYAHPFLAFKLSIPKGWARGQTNGRADCSFYGTKAEAYIPRVDLYVKLTTQDFAAFASAMKETFRKQYPDSTVDSDEVSKVRDRDAHLFVLSFTDAGIAMRSVWMLVGVPGRVYMLGWACPAASAGRFQPAILALMRSLRVYALPTAPAAQKERFAKTYIEAEEAYRKGKPAEAAAKFKECAAILPEYPEIHASLGIALLKNKDYAGAEAAFRKAIDLDPADGSHYYNFGATLLQQFKNSEAAAMLRKAAEFEPAFEPAWTNLGVALLGADDPDGAIKALEKAVAVDPESPAAHFNLGNAFERKGLKERAVAQWKEVLKLVPGHQPATDAIQRVERK